MNEDLEKLTVPELEKLLDEQRQTTIALLQEMGREYRQHPDASSVLFVRLNTLIEMMLSPEGKLIFEIRSEESMAKMLTLAMADLRKQKLTAPLGQQTGGGLFVPGN